MKNICCNLRQNKYLCTGILLFFTPLIHSYYNRETIIFFKEIMFFYIFQKWKKRFFVLFKPASSLPGEYVLNYYRDEHCKKYKGSIDLQQCEQIIESLDSESFPYLLAIKTFHKNKERTYFLATQTEDQMSSWVRSLCSVCELKPDENRTF